MNKQIVLGFVALCSVALVACGDDTTGGGGSGGGSGGAGSTTTTTNTTSTTTSGGGDGGGTTASAGGEGGAGQGGDGGAGEGGAGGGEPACIRCSDIILNEGNPADLCDDSEPLFGAFIQCICQTSCPEECADTVCAQAPPPNAECGECIETNCGDAQDACLADVE